MKRRQFLKFGSIIAIGLITVTQAKTASFVSNVVKVGNGFKERIIEIISELKAEGSNLVKKVMNGKKYEYDPYTHYPYDGGIPDKKTGYRIFFHAHRPNEYGHFHTFATDENGDLIHLLLISMNEEGEPIALATVNRWVTDDKYVKADILKKLLDNFQMDSNLFVERRVVEFVHNILNAYKEAIYDLFDERDEWIKDYVNKNFSEPFEDREFEILSERKIELIS